jgi:hypothetical protein
MTPKQRLLHEVSEAKALFERSRKALGEQPALRALLTAYGSAIEEVQNLMRQGGVTVACTLCAKQEQGGCCFEGIETAYDRILLLINLLMGYPLPERREVPGSCLFVGMEGCKLNARYYFCVHYLCPLLRTNLGPVAKHELLSSVARELAAGWELEQAVREYFRKESARAESVLE